MGAQIIPRKEPEAEREELIAVLRLINKRFKPGVSTRWRVDALNKVADILDREIV